MINISINYYSRVVVPVIILYSSIDAYRPKRFLNRKGGQIYRIVCSTQHTYGLKKAVAAPVLVRLFVRYMGHEEYPS
jgi:hypothetical protein